MSMGSMAKHHLFCRLVLPLPDPLLHKNKQNGHHCEHTHFRTLVKTKFKDFKNNGFYIKTLGIFNKLQDELKTI